MKGIPLTSYSEVKDKVFPLRSRRGQGCTHSTQLFDKVLKLLARAIRQEKEIEVIQIEKEVKSSSFLDNKFVLTYLLPYLFMAALGLHCCAWAFSSCGERGLLFFVVLGLLIVVASLVAEHGL